MAKKITRKTSSIKSKPTKKPQAGQPDDGVTQQVLNAMQARLDGKVLRPDEAQALRKYESRRDERMRWQHYESITKGHLCKLAGRSQKVISNRTIKYDMPITSSVDLRLFFRWFFDFLDDLPDLKKLENDDDMMASNDRSPALERYRLARAKSEELTLEERTGNLIDRGAIHQTLGQIAGLLRGCGETLQRQYGPDALGLLNETIDDIELIIKRSFDAGTPHNSSKLL